MTENKGFGTTPVMELPFEGVQNEMINLEDEDSATGPTFIPVPVQEVVEQDEHIKDYQSTKKGFREEDDQTGTIDITMGTLRDKTLDEFTPKDYYYHLLHTKNILEKIPNLSIKEPADFSFEMINNPGLKIVAEFNGNDYEIDTDSNRLGGNTLNSSFKAIPLDTALPPLFIKFVDITMGGRFQKSRDKRFVREYVLQELNVLGDVDIEGIPKLEAVAIYNKDNEIVDEVFTTGVVDGESQIVGVNVPDRFVIATSFEKEGESLLDYLEQERDSILNELRIEKGQFTPTI
jgi:hypothetical protein